MSISGVSSSIQNRFDYATQQAQAQQLQAAQQNQQVQAAAVDKDHDNDQGSEAAEGLGKLIDIRG